jgi:hypothetical protein
MKIPGFGPNGLAGLGHTGTHILLILILIYLVFFTSNSNDE